MNQQQATRLISIFSAVLYSSVSCGQLERQDTRPHEEPVMEASSEPVPVFRPDVQQEVGDNQRLDPFAQIGNLEIVHFVNTLEQGLPVIRISIRNNGANDEILGELRVRFKYIPYAGIPEARRLTPLAYWDVELPFRSGELELVARSPVLIPSHQIGTIAVRFFSRYGRLKFNPANGGSCLMILGFTSSSGSLLSSQLVQLMSDHDE